MSRARIAVLPDRGTVTVTGEDARKLLGGVITGDVELLDTQPAIFAGLLSPQGKVLFDFIVVRDGTGYSLDVARDKATDLAKRLTMYRLRARVDIAVASSFHHVLASWSKIDELSDDTDILPLVCYRDPRLPDLGWRALMGPVRDHWFAADFDRDGAEADYHAHRIALGIPEGGRDYDFGDTFPHEANFDLIGGVSFEKGCYVGQEIVARMEHRGTVRKRIVRVTGAVDLAPTRPDVTVGDVVIGKLGSVAGRQGLAMLRLDRAIEAIDKGEAIIAGGVALAVDSVMLAAQRKLIAEKGANP